MSVSTCCGIRRNYGNEVGTDFESVAAKLEQLAADDCKDLEALEQQFKLLWNSGSWPLHAVGSPMTQLSEPHGIWKRNCVLTGAR